jgi:LacI family transcriptional regulator
VRVPDEMSLVGFDDMPIARDVTPPLTTVRLPLVDMGVRAMALALDAGQHAVPLVEQVDATLVERGSTAPPR